MKKVIDKAKALKLEIETLKKDGEANRKKLGSKTEECKKEIAVFRRVINKILDKMEEKILVTLGKKSNQHLQVIERQIATLTASLKALDTDLDAMDNAHKTNRDEIMFSANVKLSKSISEYDELTKDIRNSMHSPNLEFQENNKLIDMLKNMEGFGRIEEAEADSTQQHHLMILDMKVKSTKEVSIKLSDDTITPNITGCTFLSNGRILLCDFQNQKVKLLDSDMSVKKSLKLSDGPYNVAAVGENEAIITFGPRDINNLQYIYTHPELKLCKKIALPNKCYGLHVDNDEIYTACHKSSGHDEIWRLDRAGNIMSKIVLTQNSSGWSEYLGLCLAGSSPCVYLTDYFNHRVTCFQLDGKMVYQYQDKKLKRTNGIYVDSAGNSLVCGTISHNVVVITADGRKHGELLTSKDIRLPKCVEYRPEDNTLIVGCLESPKLFMYKLGK